MDLDIICPALVGSLYLISIRVYEEADRYTPVLKPGDSVSQMIHGDPDVQPSLGCQFLSLLGNQGAAVRLYGECDGQHFGCSRHLKVKACLHGLAQKLQVAV